MLDRATLRPARAPINLPGGVIHLLPDPRDGSLYAITRTGAVLHIEPATGEVEQVADPGTFRDESQYSVLSPDATRLAAVNAGGQLQLIDVDTWTWFGTTTQWGDDEFLFSPDGGQLALLEDDRLTLADGRTGRLQARLPLPGQVPDARMAYLPDGSGIIVTGVDGRIWTVDARPSAWLERACRIAGRNLSRQEWREYFPSRPYEVTCPESPRPSPRQAAPRPGSA